MKYLYPVLAFAAGLIAVLLLVRVRKLKVGHAFGFLLNSMTGAAVLAALTLTKTVILPLNPFNALLTGALGVAGVAAVFVITRWL